MPLESSVVAVLYGSAMTAECAAVMIGCLNLMGIKGLKVAGAPWQHLANWDHVVELLIAAHLRQ